MALCSRTAVAASVQITFCSTFGWNGIHGEHEACNPTYVNALEIGGRVFYLYRSVPVERKTRRVHQSKKIAFVQSKQ